MELWAVVKRCISAQNMIFSQNIPKTEKRFSVNWDRRDAKVWTVQVEVCTKCGQKVWTAQKIGAKVLTELYANGVEQFLASQWVGEMWTCVMLALCIYLIFSVTNSWNISQVRY